MKYYILDILKDILHKNANISGFYFIEFPSSELLQTPSSKIQRKQQVSDALNIRKEYGFSFWESIMSTFIENEDPDLEILKEALRHNPKQYILYHCPISFSELSKFLDDNADKNIALSSKVSINKKDYHIPLVDFHIVPSSLNQKIAISVLRNLGLNSGFLINSGKSYHFIGIDLISQKNLELLLAKMLFYTPVIDRNWIAHQLIERECALRITKGEKCQPILIDKLI